MTPQSIDYPAFLSSDLNVSVGKPSQVYSNNQPLMQFENLKQPPRERYNKNQNLETKTRRFKMSWVTFLEKGPVPLRAEKSLK